MALILNIETATKTCSVALSKNGEVIALKEQTEAQYSHSEQLNLFIIEALKSAHVSMKDLDAVAISTGPGSYTGLRIGASTAKGICYGLDLPLIAVSTLQAMALGLTLTLSKGEGSSVYGNDELLKQLGQKSFKEHSNKQGYETSNPYLWNKLKPRSRHLRKEPTQSEQLLWQELRNSQLGFKIRRQHVIDQFIVDFVCIPKKLVIEVDEEIHKNQIEEDLQRTAILNQNGFKVIRFTNEEVQNDLDKVLQTIKTELETREVLSFEEDLGEALMAPMIDARRMEVYTALYNSNAEELAPVSAMVIDENSFSEELANGRVLFLGDGAEKCKVALSHHTNAVFLDNIHPSAANMATFSEAAFVQQQFEDVAYFEPFYLKDFIAIKPKKLV